MLLSIERGCQIYLSCPNWSSLIQLIFREVKLIVLKGQLAIMFMNSHLFTGKIISTRPLWPNVTFRQQLLFMSTFHYVHHTTCIYQSCQYFITTHGWWSRKYYFQKMPDIFHKVVDSILAQNTTHIWWLCQSFFFATLIQLTILFVDKLLFLEWWGYNKTRIWNRDIFVSIWNLYMIRW